VHSLAWFILLFCSAGPRIAAIFSVVESFCRLKIPMRHYLASIASTFCERCDGVPPGRIDAPRAARSKQARQNTGRPLLGKNGTIVGLPHSAQMTHVSRRRRMFPSLALQLLQCFAFMLKLLCFPRTSGALCYGNTENRLRRSVALPAFRISG
jgi:hypothetical protein